MNRSVVRRGSAALLLLAIAACDRILPERQDLSLPSAEDVAQLYARQGVDADVALSGNVVEIRVTQDWRQLQRGGSLWARVGPYIYVFSPATKELFETWGGVAAVRAITVTANGEEVARALLPRDALNDVTWRRSLNLLGTALQQGTERPSRLEDLVEWGEEYTEHQYSPEYVPE
ncbi:MAG: hypothetical protein GX539_17095 [Candidatus Cloacimonetes bacterium]|jgi:hypothetical protein|nr:hypothetical protein [Candidatus Cloacimonadota bacterium]